MCAGMHATAYSWRSGLAWTRMCSCTVCSWRLEGSHGHWSSPSTCFWGRVSLTRCCTHQVSWLTGFWEFSHLCLPPRSSWMVNTGSHIWLCVASGDPDIGPKFLPQMLYLLSHFSFAKWLNCVWHSLVSDTWIWCLKVCNGKFRKEISLIP